MRICWSQVLMIIMVILLGIASMLAGCGKKGSLYLADDIPQIVAKPATPQQTTDKKQKPSTEPLTTELLPAQP